MLKSQKLDEVGLPPVTPQVPACGAPGQPFHTLKGIQTPAPASPDIPLYTPKASRHHTLPKSLARLFRRDKDPKLLEQADQSASSEPTTPAFQRLPKEDLAPPATRAPAITLTPAPVLYNDSATMLSTRYNTETDRIERLLPGHEAAYAQLAHAPKVKRKWQDEVRRTQEVERSSVTDIATTEAEAEVIAEVEAAASNKERSPAETTKSKNGSSQTDAPMLQGSGSLTGEADTMAIFRPSDTPSANRSRRKRDWFGSLGRRGTHDSGVAGLGTPRASEACDGSGASVEEENVERWAVWKAKERRKRKWYGSLGKSSALKGLSR